MTSLLPRWLFICTLISLSSAQQIGKLAMPTSPGADPGFSFKGGGGAQKIMCLHAYYERGTELTFGKGPGLGP